MFTDTAVTASARQNKTIFNDSIDEEQELVNYIRQIKQEMSIVQDDFHRFHMLMRDLEKTLLHDNDENNLYSRATSHLKKEELEYLNTLYCLWETNLENRFVKFLKAGVVKHFLDYPLYARFERLIEREVNLLSGLKPKRLLFIGSGPMPITALCLRHRLGTQIDCLERNEEAVIESKEVMKLLSCENDINIMQGFGEDIDASEYDVVVVALLAKPKHLILTNILKNAREDIKIICRTSEGSRQIFYESTDSDSVPSGLKVSDHKKAELDDTISSYLLERVEL